MQDLTQEKPFVALESLQPLMIDLTMESEDDDTDIVLYSPTTLLSHWQSTNRAFNLQPNLVASATKYRKNRHRLKNRYTSSRRLKQGQCLRNRSTNIERSYHSVSHRFHVYR